ncbi:MAG: PAS domain S-box protein [Deltaproteobacteria bacterium]|nr:PAS domain S-box protein [Deltaproteobacteria bacterium]
MSVADNEGGVVGPGVYEFLFEHALHPILVTTVEGSIIRCNDAAIRALGWSEGELRELGSKAFVVDDRALRTLLAEAVAAGSARAVLTLRRAGGAEFSADVAAQTVPKTAGATAVVSLRDITAELAAERALRESEQRDAAIYDHAPVAMALSRLPEGTIVTVNDAFVGLFECERSEALGKTGADLGIAPPADRARIAEELALRGFVRNQEVVRSTRSGQERVVSLSIEPVTILDEPHLLTVAVDITARARAERALRVSEARGRLLVERAPAAIAMLDREMRYLAHSRRFLSDYALPDESLVGRSHYDVFPEIPERWREIHRRCLAGASERCDEDPFVRADGRTAWLRWEIVPWHDADGAVGGIVLFAEDITRQKRVEAELRQSEARAREALAALERALEVTRRTEDKLRQAQKMEAIGQLAGGVAHDFNNLLTVILGNSEVLLEQLGTADPLRSDVTEIEKAGQRAAALTRQLLAFSRKQVLEPIDVDINALVNGLEKMLRRLIGEDVELTLLLEQRLPPCRLDPGQFEQALVNLAVNARDAMPDGGRLTIETANVVLDAAYVEAHPGATVGEHVRLTVTDTGTGMSREVQAHLFEPFFTTKELGRGTGLGLSTVYGIVAQSGGTIWVYSEPGQGTSFRLYFPRSQGPAIGPRTATTSAAPSARGREAILLVEDDEQVRSTVAAMLRRAGYHVIPAANGGEALLIAEQYGGTIHLMLTDVVMPHLNGRKVAERIVKIRPAVRVIFMSGYSENAIVHHGVLDAGIDLLVKPISSDTLLAKVREVLDRR